MYNVVTLSKKYMCYLCMYRCDISAMDLISSYMRPLYQVLLDYFDEMEEELTKDGKAHYVYYAKIEVS